MDMRRPMAAGSLLFLLLASSLGWMPPAGATVPPFVVAAAPAAFSPNSDGRSDTTTIAVTLDAPASLTVEVLAADGASVRVLADGIPASSGRTDFPWDGTDTTGSPAPDATYTVLASAVDGSGATTSTTSVTIDTHAPRFRWREITPEPIISSEPFHLRFESHDTDSRLDATVVVFDDAGDTASTDETIVKVGKTGIETKPRYRNGDPWLNGLYRARVTLLDDAGNRTQSPLRAFRDHRPVASRVIHRLGGTGPRVALTFDDCNDGAAWNRILSVLHDRNVHASFFCLGPNVKRFAARARRTVADGHTIGSHSMNHALETSMSYGEIRRQNHGPQLAWWNVARVTPAPYYRPPYGAYNSQVLRAVGDQGYSRTIIWDVDPSDWEHPGPSVIADRVLANARPGSIVVMHTLSGTAAALPSIIGRLRAKGLEPVSLQELFRSTGMRTPVDEGPRLMDPYE